MTTINESQTAKGYTPAGLAPAAFGRPRTIEGIVIHHWGVFGQKHDDVVKFFVDGPGATSAHFVVSAGRIDCLVSPADAAWHSGNAVGNATTIGIECHPEATEADYATVAELVRYLRDQYGALPLSPHRQWNATACPGIWDLPKIDRLAGSAAIGAVTAQGAVTTSSAPIPAAITTPAGNEDKMLYITKAKGESVIWIGDGITRRPVGDVAELTALRSFAKAGVMKIFRSGDTQDWPPAYIGAVVGGK
jgi:N-acetylmuramoyl-L-alanine amidase